MKRHQSIYTLSISALLISVWACGCTAYDDDDGSIGLNNSTQLGGTNGPIISQESTTRGLGGSQCKSGEECLSDICSNSACSCDEEAACVSGKYCTDQRVCESKKSLGSSCSKDVECSSNSCNEGVCVAAKKIVGDTCELSSECQSGMCDGRCMGECSTADDCASNMICDSGKCHSIVKCPDSEGECFTAMSLTPNDGWLGSSLSEQIINKDDYLSKHYSIELPTFADHDLSLCVRPMVDVLNIKILKATMSDFFKLLYQGTYAKYIRSVALDHFGETDANGEFVEKTYTDASGNAVSIKGGALFDAIVSSKSSNINIIEGLLSFVSENERAAAKAKTLLQVGEFVTDPRVSGRKSHIGCFTMPVQVSQGENVIPMKFKLTGDMGARNSYMKVYMSNSELMTNDSHYSFSISSTNEADDGKAYSNRLDFPVNYKVGSYDTTTMAAAAVGNSMSGDKTFYFKVNYKTGMDSFLCNEYDISMETCPGKVQIDYDQRCLDMSEDDYKKNCNRIEYNGNEYYIPQSQKLIIKSSASGLSCSKNDLQNVSFKKDYPACKPKVSVDLEKIQLLIQIDRSLDKANIKD